MSSMGAYACRSAFVVGPGRSLITNANSSFSTPPVEIPVAAVDALEGESSNRK
jgi:hypothetical protein